MLTQFLQEKVTIETDGNQSKLHTILAGSDVLSRYTVRLTGENRTGIFSRVPGEKGVYTWDVKLLSSLGK
ncbi:hypothetical protein ACN23B_27865 (plasmid) [Anabaena sp. FACHB-709]|uniref:Uncharacterized protein n=1 Tax=Anabaena cylindrica FACHB-318 TaxID=2692880 RepID=A0ABR7ZNX1_ANACY|nr:MULTISPECIES: hypothetical protein [Nostocaceae]MBD2174228.1 hypothetical protein [Anabaena cylindrica FACHB-318]MBD2266016.1 hypothetical protein [Anabaena sp. FACHB-709]MBD2275451.1 hypothetical protein [Nostoc sp. PCC 7120 = FACHB-418]MBD2287332.1 hypothetical protein [Anabaena cylindrica FACHB-170]MBD2352205.1 hypothetical protein [Trichormus variabilis FACHB-171]